MPIYEYRCRSCDQTFEKLSSMNATSAPCPSCGADCAKAISVPAKGQVGASSGAPACAASCGKAAGFG